MPALQAADFSLDARVLLVSRPSPKGTYALLLAGAVLALKGALRLPWRGVVLPALVAGVGCGLVHHAALFAHGMRGYTDAASLALTLGTEWPALIACEAAIRHAFSRAPRAAVRLARMGIYGALAAALLPHVDKGRVAEVLVPNVPGIYMQSIGTLAFRATTCLPAALPTALPPWLAREALGLAPPSLECREEGDDSVLVLAAPAKSGALLSAQLLLDIGARCGLCVASGERDAPGIPGPVEALPTYEGDILHAIIFMRGWPEYARARGRASRCVAIVRDPLARLRSLYLYARAGGEHWFSKQSAGFGDGRIGGQPGAPPIARRLRQAHTAQGGGLNASLALYWELFGRDYLRQSHEYNALNAEQGCIMLAFEEFSRDFDTACRRLLGAWGVPESAQDELIPLLRRHDVSDKAIEGDSTAEAAAARDPHVSATQYSAFFRQEVKHGLSLLPELREEVEHIRAREAQLLGR